MALYIDIFLPLKGQRKLFKIWGKLALEVKLKVIQGSIIKKSIESIFFCLMFGYYFVPHVEENGGMKLIWV